MEPLRTLGDAAKLVFAVVPRRPARRIGAASYWLALLLLAGALALDSRLASDASRRLIPYAIHGIAFVGLLALLLGQLAAIAWRRPALTWAIAALLLASQLWIEVLMWPIERWALPVSPLSPGAREAVERNLWIVLSLVALRRAADYLEPDRGVVQRTLMALALGAGFVVPLLMMPPLPLFHSIAPIAPDDDIDGEATVATTFDPELVMGSQERLVDASIAALAPQRPERVDLYVVAFGGDGSERVFRNEVEYAERLFASRFDAEGRIVTLVNAGETVESRPLATRANLRRALRGVGDRIDPAEDLVLVFLTSHGSGDHELYVALGPLPLAQITPGDVDAALDGAGIRWRVVVVSACYSGGFIPALEGPGTLVVTASRADRTSFGCGAESEFTYFGRAFLIEGLNESASPIAAFDHARRRIAEWERDEGRTRSRPQISAGAGIEAKIEQWLETFEPGPRVPFEPPRARPPAAAHERWRAR